METTIGGQSTLPDINAPQFTFVTKALGTGKDDGGRMRFKAIASSTIQDRAGDEITLSALEKMAAKFREGITVFMDHDWKHVESAFGLTDNARVVQMGIDKRSNAPIWDLEIEGFVNEPNPRAVQLWKSIDGGFVKLGTSISAFILNHERNKAGGMTIDDVDVFEASIVGVPMNQRSWVQRAVKAVKSFYGEADQEVPVEAQLGDVVELNSATGETRVIARAGTPETEEIKARNPESPADLEPAEKSAVAPDPESEFEPEEGVEYECDEPDCQICHPAEKSAEGDGAVEKAVLSAKKRKALPDSAFACPEKRKYPINDAAHVRNALARIADPSNDQCGRERILAAARKFGIKVNDEKSLDTDGDLSFTTADTTTSSGTTSLVVTSLYVKQAGQESETPLTPETPAAADDERPDPVAEKVVTIDADDMAALVRSVSSLTERLDTLRAERDAAIERAEKAEKERDAVAANLALHKEAVERLMKLPLARKSVESVTVDLANRFPQYDQKVLSKINGVSK